MLIVPSHHHARSLSANTQGTELLGNYLRGSITRPKAGLTADTTAIFDLDQPMLTKVYRSHRYT